MDFIFDDGACGDGGSNHLTVLNMQPLETDVFLYLQ